MISTLIFLFSLCVVFGGCIMFRGYLGFRRNFRISHGSGTMDLSERVMRDNMKYCREFIPTLSKKLRKGECGRIGVIGGTPEYTGAPFYSAISALKIGADVAYIICCKEAAIPIKSYSPAVIVYPYLDHSEVIYKTAPCLDRVHCLVIGPGLGRDPDVLRNVEAIINYCNFQMAAPVPLIFDADGLYMLIDNLHVVQDYKGLIILTPNALEYSRLCEKVGMLEQQIVELSRIMSVVILKKGEVDTISNGVYQRMLKLPPDLTTAVNKVVGSRRRCAGQGDILAGCLATFVTWFILYKRNQLNANWNTIFTLDSMPNISEWEVDRRKKVYNERFRGLTAACFCSSLIVRHSSYLAFGKKGRSITACDVIPYLAEAFGQFFG